MTDTFSWEDRAAMLSCFAAWWRKTGTVHYTAGRDGPGLRSWENVEFIGQHEAVESRLSRAKCLS